MSCSETRGGRSNASHMWNSMSVKTSARKANGSACTMRSRKCPTVQRSSVTANVQPEPNRKTEMRRTSARAARHASGGGEATELASVSPSKEDDEEDDDATGALMAAKSACMRESMSEAAAATSQANEQHKLWQADVISRAGSSITTVFVPSSVVCAMASEGDERDEGTGSESMISSSREVVEAEEEPMWYRTIGALPGGAGAGAAASARKAPHAGTPAAAGIASKCP
mmetsp:Transcript_59662/g.166578  ORF Transcript_59662/g.166578 Transcript_59662/m.166578 type:complete len:228 (+) Transcript_59662:238-921(+)